MSIEHTFDTNDFSGWSKIIKWNKPIDWIRQTLVKFPFLSIWLWEKHVAFDWHYSIYITRPMKSSLCSHFDPRRTNNICAEWCTRHHRRTVYSAHLLVHTVSLSRINFTCLLHFGYVPRWFRIVSLVSDNLHAHLTAILYIDIVSFVLLRGGWQIVSFISIYR